MKTTTIILISLLTACNNFEPFIQTHCEADEKFVSILFENSSASRDIYINIPNKTIRFKGTTFADLKWVADLEETNKFQVDENQILSFQRNKNKNIEFGVIEPGCKAIIQKKLKRYYQILE